MKSDDLIKHAKRMIQTAWSQGAGSGKLAEAVEFLRIYAGEKSRFYQQLSAVDPNIPDKYLSKDIKSNLEGFISFVQNDLHSGISVERKAQIDVVSDILEQANSLLETKGVHPAAPTVIIGAALEEFLRNWIEEQGIVLENKKAGLDSYSKLLRENDLITKQDSKDITSWAGLRNHAAHGEWEEVDDKKRISLMLEGVNFFMRKYGSYSI
jgi:hypothetical protein